MDISIGQLEDSQKMESGFPQSKVSPEAALWKLQWCLGSSLEVILHRFCSIYCLQKQVLLFVNGDYTKVWIPGSKHHWRTSWRLAGDDVIKGKIPSLWSPRDRPHLALLILEFFLFDSCLSAKDGHSASSLLSNKQHRKLHLCCAVKGLQGSNRKPHFSGRDFVVDLGHILCLFFLEMKLIFTCVSFLGCISNVEIKKGVVFVHFQHYKIYLYFIKWSL